MGHLHYTYTDYIIIDSTPMNYDLFVWVKRMNLTVTSMTYMD